MRYRGYYAVLIAKTKLSSSNHAQQIQWIAGNFNKSKRRVQLEARTQFVGERPRSAVRVRHPVSATFGQLARDTNFLAGIIKRDARQGLTYLGDETSGDSVTRWRRFGDDGHNLSIEKQHERLSPIPSPSALPSRTHVELDRTINEQKRHGYNAYLPKMRC
jgi:hypothetical protein